MFVRKRKEAVYYFLEQGEVFSRNSQFWKKFEKKNPPLSMSFIECLFT